jgi:hypothetical protein
VVFSADESTASGSPAHGVIALIMLTLVFVFRFVERRLVRPRLHGA